MPFEHRVRSTAEQAIGSLVQDLLAQASEDREAAVRDARSAALAEAEEQALVRIAAAESRVRTLMDDAVNQARTEEREAATSELRSRLESEYEPKIAEAVADAEARARGELADALARAGDELQAAVAAARVKERQSEMAGVTRLLESVRGLDGASTLSEVLDALALAAAREAARAAVMVLRGERITGWKVSGFGSRDAQPKLIDLLLADSGVIGLAVSAARTVTTRDNHGAAAGPGFETIPSDKMGLAVPVVVCGRVVAVVYADAVTMDGQDRPVPSSWPELIEVLARHAGRCLEALTVQKTSSTRVNTPPSAPAASGGTAPQAGAPPGSAGSTIMQMTDGVAAAARRTARLLIAEIRLFHEPAVNEGRAQRNLLSRLAPEIARAREAYNEQVPAGVRGQTDYFQQELIRTLAGGDAALLGQLV